MGEALSAEPPVVVGRSEDASVSGKKEKCVGVTEESGCATKTLAIVLALFHY